MPMVSRVKDLLQNGAGERIFEGIIIAAIIGLMIMYRSVGCIETRMEGLATKIEAVNNNVRTLNGKMDAHLTWELQQAANHNQVH